MTIVKHAVAVEGKVVNCANRDEARATKRKLKAKGKNPKIIRQQYVLAKTDVVR